MKNPLVFLFMNIVDFSFFQEQISNFTSLGVCNAVCFYYLKRLCNSENITRTSKRQCYDYMTLM